MAIAFADMMESVRGILEKSPGPHTILVPGSGPDGKSEWSGSNFIPITLDIDARNNPDIVGSMTAIGDHGPFDAVYCCHALEHLYPHEVNRALREFMRVMKSGGVLIIIVPDLEDVKPDCNVLPDYPGEKRYCGLQLFYGDFSLIEEFPGMAHHCGFIRETLEMALIEGGFSQCKAERMGGYNLMGVGIKE